MIDHHIQIGVITEPMRRMNNLIAPRSINALVLYHHADGSPSVASFVYDEAASAVTVWNLRHTRRRNIKLSSSATTGTCTLEYHEPFIITYRDSTVHLWHTAPILHELDRVSNLSMPTDNSATPKADFEIPSLAIDEENAAVTAIACNQHLLLLGYANGVINVWSLPRDCSSADASVLQRATKLHTLVRNPIAIRALRLLSDSDFACSVTHDRVMCMWSMSSGKCLYMLDGLSTYSAHLTPFSLVLNHGGDVVLYDYLKVLPASTLLLLARLKHHHQAAVVTTAAPSPPSPKSSPATRRHERKSYAKLADSDSHIGLSASVLPTLTDEMPQATTASNALEPREISTNVSESSQQPINDIGQADYDELVVVPDRDSYLKVNHHTEDDDDDGDDDMLDSDDETAYKFTRHGSICMGPSRKTICNWLCAISICFLFQGALALAVFLSGLAVKGPARIPVGIGFFLGLTIPLLIILCCGACCFMTCLLLCVVCHRWRKRQEMQGPDLVVATW